MVSERDVSKTVCCDFGEYFWTYGNAGNSPKFYVNTRLRYVTKCYWQIIEGKELLHWLWEIYWLLFMQQMLSHL